MKRLTAFLLTALIMVGVSSLSVAQEQVYSDNVMIIVDDSGSMSSSMRDNNGKQVEKMDAAKMALKEVVKTIPSSTNIGLVSFHQDWLFKLGPKNEAALNAGIDRLNPTGGTPLGQFIKFGADVLLAQREKQHGYGNYRLLIVTDGEANEPYYVDLYTPEVMARGITIDVIGVNMDKDHTLATKVHSYRNAKDPASLKQAIAEVLAEVPDKGNDSTGSNEAFEIIASLPDGFAEKAIAALADSGNQPIGEKPQPKAQTAEGQIDNGQAQASAEPQLPDAGMSGGKILLIVVGCILAFIVVGILFGSLLDS